MSAQEVGAIVTIVVALSGAAIAWRKFRPESNDIVVTTADKVNEMTLRFAGAVDQDNDDLREQLKTLQREFAQYRMDTDGRLAELSTRLRAATAENVRLETENGQLKARVTELESEVARLRDAKPTPDAP